MKICFIIWPGTYDITVKRSIPSIKKRGIDNLELYFLSKIFKKSTLIKETKKIDKFLFKNKFNFNSIDLYKYIVLSLKLENSKFIFTRALSDYLQIIEKWGQKSQLALKN